MAQRGRPRAITLNRAAVDHLMAQQGLDQRRLGELAAMSRSHLGDALTARRKGVSEETVGRLAVVLGCTPAVIAPELAEASDGKRTFYAARPGDDI